MCAVNETNRKIWQFLPKAQSIIPQNCVKITRERFS